MVWLIEPQGDEERTFPSKDSNAFSANGLLRGGVFSVRVSPSSEKKRI
jgi:hypothetical protein